MSVLIPQAAGDARPSPSFSLFAHHYFSFWFRSQEGDAQRASRASSMITSQANHPPLLPSSVPAAPMPITACQPPCRWERDASEDPKATVTSMTPLFRSGHLFAVMPIGSASTCRCSAWLNRQGTSGSSMDRVVLNVTGNSSRKECSSCHSSNWILCRACLKVSKEQGYKAHGQAEATSFLMTAGFDTRSLLTFSVV